MTRLRSETGAVQPVPAVAGRRLLDFAATSAGPGVQYETGLTAVTAQGEYCNQTPGFFRAPI